MCPDGKTARIALVGNPNCGKTTLFNALTGSRQSVGNWPGVTVTKKSGKTKRGYCELTDLPGIYSLAPYSMEERIARDFILKETPDAIINIVDGTNLERNLYLSVQLLELEIPMVVAVNMMDDLESRGWALDWKALSESLGVPVVPIAARRGRNIEKLRRTAEELARLALSGYHKRPLHLCGDSAKRLGEYPVSILNAANAIGKIELLLESTHSSNHMPQISHIRFWAGNLLEGDCEAFSCLGLSERERQSIEDIANGYEESADCGDCETMLADARYRWIEQAVSKSLRKSSCPQGTATQRIDAVLTGKFTALLCFLLIMGVIFTLTFGALGKALSKMIETFFSELVIPAANQWLCNVHAPSWCRGLILDASLGGLSGILVFLPQIALLFFGLSILEDSGYMARAAFLMDRGLRKIGLSGKSFIPMLMGFGCTTPALMAARTLENEKDRRMTMMLTPFMSCGARLPIYAVFAGAFFPTHQGVVVLFMYLLGIGVAILVGMILKHTLMKGETPPFVMELPPYRFPMLKSVFRNVWEKCRGFLVKAGTVIFAMNVAVWFFRSFTPEFLMTANPAESILGLFGAWIAPAFEPIGFGSWQAVVSLLTGLIAKESVAVSLGLLYAGNGISLTQALAAAFSPASALSFMTFSLLYMPCISAFVTLKKEMGSLRWAAGTALMQTGAAYTAAAIIYHIALLVPGWGTSQAAAAVCEPKAWLATGDTGGESSVAVVVCVLLTAMAGVILYRSVLRALRGKCCGCHAQCKDCRMKDECAQRTHPGNFSSNQNTSTQSHPVKRVNEQITPQ